MKTEAPLRVTVSCPAKFHAWQLAWQLERHGALTRLLTDDLRALAAPGVPPWKVRVLAPLDAVNRLGPRVTTRVNWPHLRVRAHDHVACRMLGDANVVIAWSGAARRTMEEAKKSGALAVVERGSAHIQHQDAVLREEYPRFGLHHAPISREGVENELREYETADRIMVPSTFAKRTFVERGIPAEKVLHVPYGADVSRFHPGTPPEAVFRIAFVGALSLQKGIPYLLQAFEKLALPDGELLLVGPVLPEIEPVLKRHPRNVRTVGPKPSAEVAELLRTCHVFAFPSLQEGLSLALREAHATGLPIVATDASGVEDVIDPGVDGFVVAPRDVDAMAARIEQLYRDRELRRSMAEAAARRARGWGWDDYGDAIVETYTRELAALRANR